MRAIIAMGAALAGAASALAQGAAHTNTCYLLSPEQVAPLIGSAKPPKPIDPAHGCTWGGAGTGGGSSAALMVTAPKMSAASAAPTYHEMEKAARAKHAAQVKDEAGMGDAAFSEVTGYGARVVALKGSRVLQLQFTTGKPATATQVDALRAVAKKAVAAF